jgi:hypothetical protein
MRSDLIFFSSKTAGFIVFPLERFQSLPSFQTLLQIPYVFPMNQTGPEKKVIFFFGHGHG